jgi:hypothetical protein
VAALAGTLTVDSPPGAGTRIRAELPLPALGSRKPSGYELGVEPGDA